MEWNRRDGEYKEGRQMDPWCGRLTGGAPSRKLGEKRGGLWAG